MLVELYINVAQHDKIRFTCVHSISLWQWSCVRGRTCAIGIQMACLETWTKECNMFVSPLASKPKCTMKVKPLSKCWCQNPSWQRIIDWSHLLPIHVRVCCAYLAIYTSYVDLQLFTTLGAMLLWTRMNTKLSDLNYLGWLGHFLDHMGLRVKHIL